MNRQQFTELAKQGYNRVPVCRQVLADLDTPVSSYLKLATGDYSYLFESVQGGEKWGRYSIIGLPCRKLIKIYDHTVNVIEDKQIIDSFDVDDPLAYVEQLHSEFKVAELEGIPKFSGGLVGYFSYDTVRYVEPKLAATTPDDDPLQTPDILLMVSDDVLVFDNLEGTLHLITHADPNDGPEAFDEAQARLQDLAERLPKSADPIKEIDLSGDQAQDSVQEDDFKSGFNQQDFEAAVEKIREYIIAGDTMQVVISQRLSLPFDADPINLYRALRYLNPSPYMYFLDLDDFHVVGSSPEILARLEDNTVTVRPIAGTRRRGHTAEEDIALEKELLADPKELAEHLMLIDLGRNDAGRVSEIGTVRLTDKMIVERYSHVMHIVSNVTGQLREGLSAVDVLRAALPAGTLSGAPKIRAMEIIDELEPVKRGVYGGAVGYIAWNGNMDTAIAIRTAVIKDKQLNIQAGAGVVADSIPALEWKETMNKARAMFKAVGLVQEKR